MLPSPDFANAVVAKLREHADHPGLPPLTDGQLEQLAHFCAVLADENGRRPLTAIAGPEDMALRHIIDSLLAAPLLPADGEIADLGSGGGVPGIPLAVALPGAHVHLVESRGGRVESLRHIVGQLDAGLGLAVVHDRLERWLSERRVDAVVARAVGPTERLLKLLSPCREQLDRVVLMKGPAGHDELAAVRPHLKRLGFRLTASEECALPEGAGRRLLLVFEPLSPRAGSGRRSSRA